LQGLFPEKSVMRRVWETRPTVRMFCGPEGPNYERKLLFCHCETTLSRRGNLSFLLGNSALLNRILDSRHSLPSRRRGRE
jgi:hypothetical protein